MLFSRARSYLPIRTNIHRINEKFQETGTEVKKGEEIGLFQFGGSSIIVAFESGRIQFDEDLLSVSRRRIMMDVEVGMSLGTALKSQ
jgi:phosphatidylserine decarboxylase